ncbi:MAG: hypothetical protein ACK578_01690, partial [Pirellula sp.]
LHAEGAKCDGVGVACEPDVTFSLIETFRGDFHLASVELIDIHIENLGTTQRDRVRIDRILQASIMLELQSGVPSGRARTGRRAAHATDSSQ